MAKLLPNVRRGLRWFVVILSICLTLYVILLAAISHSEAFAVAKRFLFKNSCLSSALGSIDSVRPSYLRTSRIAQDATHGYAYFTVVVSGKRATATVHVKLVKNLGKWSITLAMLDDGSNALFSGDLTACHQ
jgi:hypothetical protein